MEAFFSKIVSTSYEATIVLGFVLVARLVLELLKAPKKYCSLLWALPFLRMILPLLQLMIPVKFESIFSLMPAKQIVQTGQGAVTLSPHPAVAVGNSGAGIILNETMPTTVDAVSSQPTNWVGLLALLWVVGAALFLAYGVVSYLQLKAKLKCSMRTVENIYLADYIDTPFVLGIIKPRIYIPSGTTKEEYRYVLAHEKMHLQRKDHLYKLVAFLILGLHWFNPFAWIAYLLLCKDMEMACDEAVMAQFGDDCKQEYAKALLDWSAGKKLKGVPLAFSEGNVKGRIRNVLRYKKPLIGISIVAVVALVVLAVCLLSDPVSTEKNSGEKNSGEKNENATVKLGSYTLVADDENVFAGIHIDEATMSFSYHAASSYFPYGTYKIDGDILTLTTMEERQYRFRIDGDSLIFVAEGSATIPQFEMEGVADVTDGSVFKYVEEVTLPAEIEITAPVLSADMDLGADGAILDYADNQIVIFHGYFGLFVYDRTSQTLIGAVDLEPIGCNFTQGDDVCEVYVEADGSKVYLSPLSSNMMYVYDVAAQTLIMEPHDLSGVQKFESFKDGSEFIDDWIGFRSYRRAEVTRSDGSVTYGYLFSIDGTVGQLGYAEGAGEEHVEYFIFQDYFLEESKEQLEGVEGQPDAMDTFETDIQSNIWGMGVEELSRTGTTFTVYNNSDKEIQFGEDYKLFVQENKEWVEVPYIIEDWAFTMPAYPVDPQSSRTETVDWEWLYGELPDGIYLFEKTIMYKNDSGEWEHVELGVMFSFPTLETGIHP